LIVVCIIITCYCVKKNKEDKNEYLYAEDKDEDLLVA